MRYRATTHQSPDPSDPTATPDAMDAPVESVGARLRTTAAESGISRSELQAPRISDYSAFFTLKHQGDPGRLVEAGPSARIFGNPQRDEILDVVAGRFG